jgi:hypothetical protein
MKNNFWDKKFIESSYMHNFHRGFAWLIKFILIFNQILFFIDFIF